jgi:DNA mismatch repair protein MutS2
MDPITLHALEYEGLKFIIAENLRSDLGRQALELLLPETDPGQVARMRKRAAEALAYLKEIRPPAPAPVDDPAETMDELEPEGSLVDPVKLSKLIAVIRAAVSYRDEMGAARTRFPRLWDVASEMPSLKPLLSDLSGKISSEGRVEDHASVELMRLRRHVASVEMRLGKLMNSLLERHVAGNKVQDAFVTVRNSRYVIPVKVESRREIPGIIHGSSSTGATVFLEPMEAVDGNNELVTVREEEEAEVRKILIEMCTRVRSRLPELRTMRKILGRADLIGALAQFAKDFDCLEAETGDEIVLERARHPVLQAALDRRKESIIPLDIQIKKEEEVLVLSGPNTGGKTVSLKTIGLLALMNQSGMLVPARRAVFPVFKQVLADVGDRQSITENLSTFSARMIRIAEMSQGLTDSSLVLLDEVGGGTDPEEEGALAVAIVDHFKEKGAAVIATTHHGALKAYAEMTGGVVNASMEFDEAELIPTYKFIPGVAGRSGGLDMATRFGLPDEILADARSRMSDSHKMADDYLARLHALVEKRDKEFIQASHERDRAVKERKAASDKARKEELKLRESYDNALNEAMGAIADAGADVASQVKDRATALQLRSERRTAAKKAQDAIKSKIAPPAPRHMSARDLTGLGPTPEMQDLVSLGDPVHVITMNATGILESVDRKKGKAVVLLRGMRMKVSLADCQPPGGPAPTVGGRASLPQGISLDTGGKENVPTEINLIGKRVEEAQDLLDKFLDDTMLAGHKEIRIVHGHGSGRLRAAVAEFLKQHPLVASHHSASPKAGGTGATVAVLKD